jgi:hypothetical protein
VVGRAHAPGLKEPDMSRYTVVYLDEGTFVDRDARWFKVQVLKDRDSLGIALGIFDEPSWDREMPGGGDGPRIFANAAVRLLAITIQEEVEAGAYRQRWALEAEEFILDPKDARHLVNTGVAEARSNEADAAVAFFQL